jgi:hypothetical protein
MKLLQWLEDELPASVVRSVHYAGAYHWVVSEQFLVVLCVGWHACQSGMGYQADTMVSTDEHVV